jgi:glycosyltransferase involved in cell wall biosynthesis
MEVLVVEGNSQDKTKEIVQRYSQKYHFIRLLDNPKKTTPISMNIGIKNSRGEVILKIDAHTVYNKNYLINCLRALKKYKADNVGGVLIAKPAEKTLVAKAIAFSLSSFFGSGNSYFRTGSKRPREADTVAFGCYRKDVFKRIGLYNEKLTRGQDMELNQRLKKAGGKIILAPDILAYYYPKASLRDFWAHNIKDGFWATYPLKFVKMPLKLRHYVPLIFVLSIIISALFFSSLFKLIIIFYILFSFYFSSKTALKEKDIRYLFLMPIVFAIRHIGYGLGSIWGLLNIWR